MPFCRVSTIIPCEDLRKPRELLYCKIFPSSPGVHPCTGAERLDRFGAQSGATHIPQGAPEHFAALPKRGAGYSQHHGHLMRGQRKTLPDVEPENGRSDLGRREERRPAHARHDRRTGIRLDDHGEQPIDLAARGGDYSRGHLVLDHDDQATAYSHLEESDQQRGGHGIWQVCDNFIRPKRKRAGIQTHGVGMDDLNRGVWGRGGLQYLNETPIYLDRGDVGPSPGQRRSERADTGTNFQDSIGGMDLGRVEKTLEDPAVDEEMLPPRGSQPQPEG